MGFNMHYHLPSDPNQDCKPMAFLNLWFPTADGKRRKLGSFVLREALVHDKELIEQLLQPGGLLALASHMEMEFQVVHPPRSDSGA